MQMRAESQSRCEGSSPEPLASSTAWGEQGGPARPGAVASPGTTLPWRTARERTGAQAPPSGGSSAALPVTPFQVRQATQASQTLASLPGD